MSPSCVRDPETNKYSSDAKLLLWLAAFQTILFAFVFYKLNMEKYSDILRRMKQEDSQWWHNRGVEDTFKGIIQDLNTGSMRM